MNVIFFLNVNLINVNVIFGAHENIYYGLIALLMFAVIPFVYFQMYAYTLMHMTLYCSAFYCSEVDMFTLGFHEIFSNIENMVHFHS